MTSLAGRILCCDRLSVQLIVMSCATTAVQSTRSGLYTVCGNMRQTVSSCSSSTRPDLATYHQNCRHSLDELCHVWLQFADVLYTTVSVYTTYNLRFGFIDFCSTRRICCWCFDAALIVELRLRWWSSSSSSELNIVFFYSYTQSSAK